MQFGEHNLFLGVETMDIILWIYIIIMYPTLTAMHNIYKDTQL